MTKRFAVPAIDLFSHIDHSSTQIVFHAINKSGSRAMANVIRDSYLFQNRGNELYGNYFPKVSTEDYIQQSEFSPVPCFLVGHYLYGALRPIPNRVWITQFRNPLPRVLSCYNWLKNKANKRSPDMEYPSLEKWIINTGGREHSMITQFGAGYGAHKKSLEKKLTLENLYEISLDCLDRDVTCIGIAEYFEESIFFFASIAGIPEVGPWVRDQRNPGRPLSHEISPKIRDLVSEIFYYDFLLYEYAIERFRKQLLNVDFGNSLQKYKEYCLDQYNDRIIPKN